MVLNDISSADLTERSLSWVKPNSRRGRSSSGPRHLVGGRGRSGQSGSRSVVVRFLIAVAWVILVTLWLPAASMADEPTPTSAPSVTADASSTPTPTDTLVDPSPTDTGISPEPSTSESVSPSTTPSPDPTSSTSTVVVQLDDGQWGLLYGGLCLIVFLLAAQMVAGWGSRHD